MEDNRQPLTEETNIYFLLRNFADPDLPRLQFLRFSSNGWLMETINILASGEHEIKLASDRMPLSIAPVDPMDIEEKWQGGEVVRSTPLEFECIRNLLTRFDHSSQ